MATSGGRYGALGNPEGQVRLWGRGRWGRGSRELPNFKVALQDCDNARGEKLLAGNLVSTSFGAMGVSVIFQDPALAPSVSWS